MATDRSKTHDFLRAKSIFEAAVSTVKNMPQDGPFKPSYATMKTFYGLYKQATVGPCRSNKPSLFDPVGRAKWDAWSSLGDLSTEGAMVQYTDEFVKALLSNSQSDNIEQFSQNLNESPKTAESAQFISAITPFLDAISMSINGDSNICESNGDAGVDNIGDGNGDRKSDANADRRSNSIGDTKTDEIGETNGLDHDGSHMVHHIGDGRGDNIDAQNGTDEIDNLSSSSENEDFCDTLDQVEISDDEENEISLQHPATVTYNPSHRVTEQGKVTCTELGTGTVVDGRQGSGRASSAAPSNQHLLKVLENIQRDMAEMISKIALLENQLKRNITAKRDGKVTTSYFANLTLRQIAVHTFLICVWPFVIRWFIKYIWRKKDH